MKVGKEAISRITQMRNEKPHLRQEEVIAVLKEFETPPDAEKLVNQEYKRTANRLMAATRDARGVRDVFVAKTGDEAVYVNVGKSENTQYLANIKNQLSKKQKGLSRSLRKVSYREKVVEQLSLFGIDGNYAERAAAAKEKAHHGGHHNAQGTKSANQNLQP